MSTHRDYPMSAVTVKEGRPASKEKAAKAACSDFSDYIHVRLDPLRPGGVGTAATETEKALSKHVRPLSRMKQYPLAAAFAVLAEGGGPPRGSVDRPRRQRLQHSWNEAVDIAASECGLANYVEAARQAERDLGETAPPANEPAP